MGCLVRRPSGEYRIIDEYGRITEGQTLTCVHCGAMWQIIPGSGRERGFCFRCMGPTCDRNECNRCLPYERQLEIIEQRHRLYLAMDQEFQ